MASYRKELTRERKEIIVQLSNSGFSSYKTEGMTEINSKTVQKFLKHEGATLKTYHGVEAGEKKPSRDDRILYRSKKSVRLLKML